VSKAVSGLIIHMTTSEPGSSLHILFNFLDRSPQSSAEGQDDYWTVVQAMQQHDQFLEGMLLKNVDDKSAFPYLHYVVFNTNRDGGFKHDPQWEKVVDEGYGYGQTKNRSAFREMYTFIEPSLPFLPKRSNNPNVAYIVSAFKTLGGLDALDQTWSIWSGADFIAANAPAALKLQRLTLHKRTDTRGTFTYVLVCELSEGLADVMRTREFIEQIKCRECGFTSLFTVDHFF